MEANQSQRLTEARTLAEEWQVDGWSHPKVTRWWPLPTPGQGGHTIP